jgi:outer membrane receptor protein involved in Fe transport
MIRLFTAFIFLFSFLGLKAQNATVFGVVMSKTTNQALPFATVMLLNTGDSSFVSGAITDEEGKFIINKLKKGKYTIKVSFIGFNESFFPVMVGELSDYLNLGAFYLQEDKATLSEFEVVDKRNELTQGLEKKNYNLDENLSQLGGSVLQALQNLPGITIDQNGRLFLRGSDKVAVLIDGQQSALTGMGTEQNLENIPASAIERVEIINNPSAKYDASGNAGIINIIFKKEEAKGWNGKAGFNLGLGNLWLKQENLPGTRPQFRFTPKVNPNIAINYRQQNLNFFLQADVLYREQVMKNEFITRTFEDGTVINQQFLEYRRQPIYNVKTGVDWEINKKNTLTTSLLYNYRAYTDLGDLPYFDGVTGAQLRFWEYYEKEVNQTLLASVAHEYKFSKPGKKLLNTFNYSFRRKDEVFDFTNTTPNLVGNDKTALIADEHIFELNTDFTLPLKQGKLELGAKQRARVFPNLITFSPGENSILDLGLAGSAEYREYLSAWYGNYIYEKEKLQIEAGLRFEYAQIDYLVDPNHAVYESDGFNYFEPFPNVRFTYNVNENQKISAFYNRRVDRPEEKYLRVFPSYSDPEILGLGNPSLLPMFTQNFEIAQQLSFNNWSLYSAIYYRLSNNIFTQILTEVPGSTQLINVWQNAGIGTNSGVELIFSTELSKQLKLNLNGNIYQNVIEAFSLTNAYPENINFEAGRRQLYSGNIKLNIAYSFFETYKLQFTATYLAPDIVPQGKILERYFADLGISKAIQKGKGELFFNVSDIFNTLEVAFELEGTDFTVSSRDFFETQVIRFGYSYRF